MIPTADLRAGQESGIGPRAFQGDDAHALEQAVDALRESEERYRRVVQTLAEGVVLFDAAGVARSSNPAAKRLLALRFDPSSRCYTSESGTVLIDEAGGELAEMEHPAARTRRTGAPISNVVLGLRRPGQSPRWLSVNTRVACSRVRGSPFPVVASFADVTRLKDAEAALLERASALEHLGDDRLALIDALFAQTRVGLGVLDCELRYVRVNEALARVNGLPPQAHLGRTVSELLPDLPPTVTDTLRRVVQTGEPAIDLEVTGATPARPGEPRHFQATYSPMHDRRGRLVGISLVVLDVTERRRAEADRRQLLERERQARGRTARLQEVTAALAAAVSERDIAQVLVQQGTRAIGVHRGWVSLLDADRRFFELAATERYSEELIAQFARIPADARLPGPDCAREGRPRWYESAEAFASDYPQHQIVWREARLGSLGLVPIIGPSGPLGFLAVSDERVGRLDEHGRGMLETIAAQCGQALERSRIYEREHRTADSLAQSLLPPRLPEIPGLTLAARHQPALGPHLEVGGDFYDVFAAGEGRWVLVVGDICGKGPEAAALTALARYTLRAHAMHTTRPGRLLALLNQAILAQAPDGRFCSVACATVRVDGPGARVALACGGHPPPVLLRADGRNTELAGRPGTLLGLFAEPRLPEAELELSPGETLLLYTDGALEAGAPERVLEPHRLAALVAATRPDSAGDAARRAHEVALEGVAVPRDDIAILAVRVEPSHPLAGVLRCGGAGAPAGAHV